MSIFKSFAYVESQQRGQGTQKEFHSLNDTRGLASYRTVQIQGGCEEADLDQQIADLFTTNDVCSDGKPFFSDAHPDKLSSNPSRQFSNDIDAKATLEGFAGALDSALDVCGPDGKSSVGSDWTILCPNFKTFLPCQKWAKEVGVKVYLLHNLMGKHPNSVYLVRKGTASSTAVYVTPWYGDTYCASLAVPQCAFRITLHHPHSSDTA